MTSSFIQRPEVITKYGLTPGNTFEQEFSLVSLENIFFETFAFALWSLDTLMDIFRGEMETEMEANHAHTKEWYRQKPLGFHFGVPVIPGTDKFDLTGLSDEQIESAKVIKQAATVKLISSNGYGILRIKVATANESGELEPVPTEQFNALKDYMLRHVVDAGTQVKLTTGPADQLRLVMDVYYDSLVLSNTGSRLDGTNDTPVQTSITDYLRSIEFNGMLILGDLERVLQTIQGVKRAKVKEAASKYGDYDYTTEGITNVGAIDEIRIADSGYMKVDELVINWKQIPE